MKESTYISARGYAMRIGRIFVYGCIAYALYSIATCSVCSSTSSEDAKARQKSEQTTSNTEDNIETKLSDNERNGNNKKDSDEYKKKENSDYTLGKEKVQPDDKLHQISKGIGDKINYAVDNITDNVSGHIKKKADDATKPYIEPWKELGAEVGRYGRALSNDYRNGKLLKN